MVKRRSTIKQPRNLTPIESNKTTAANSGDSPKKRVAAKVKLCRNIEAFLTILHDDGNVYEIRSIDCPIDIGKDFRTTASGYFNDLDAAIEAAEALESRNPPAVYVTLNPVNPDLLGRASNRLAYKAKSTTSDEEICKRQWLMIDIDSIKPAGISATDSEYAAAKKLGNKIRGYLCNLGWPMPLICHSGNGVYLLYRIDLPNNDESTDLIKTILKSLANQFDNEQAEVDPKTFNASRLLKVIGTTARKGDSINDRPHRKSGFVISTEDLKLVSKELLTVFAETNPSSPKQACENVSSFGPADPDVLKQASSYLASMPPAVSGKKGHNDLLKASGALVQGFCLSDEDALKLLLDEYNPRCKPKWSEKDIEHKIREVRKKEKSPGYLLHRDHTDPLALNDWSDPVDIDCPELPKFPIERLEGFLKQWILAVAHTYQVSDELPALLALAAISGTIQKRIVVVAGSDWIEPVNLFVACLQQSGSRKSAVFAEALEPLRQIEADLMEDSAPKIARASEERKIREKELSNLEKKAAKGCQDSQEAAGNLAVELATNPLPEKPRLIFDDSTAEAVEEGLMTQGGRLIISGVEGGLFEIMAGRYSGSPNMDVFLKGHAGEDLRVDRLNRAVLIRKSCLTLIYAFQPEVIKGLADKPAFRGKGLIARILFAVPESNLGTRLIETEKVPPELQLEYESLFRRLMGLDASCDDPRLLTMAEDAYQLFVEFRQEVELMLADDGRLASLRDWGGKLCGLVARLAAVLHVATKESTEPWKVPIDLETIQYAIDVGRWAIPHAEAAIGLMKAGSGVQNDACDVLEFIRSVGEKMILQRDIGQKFRSRFDGDQVRLKSALERLIDTGWIRPVKNDKRVGRPSTVFECHPKIWC